MITGLPKRRVEEQPASLGNTLEFLKHVSDNDLGEVTIDSLNWLNESTAGACQRDEARLSHRDELSPLFDPGQLLSPSIEGSLKGSFDRQPLSIGE
jgi:hypothetical protein